MVESTSTVIIGGGIIGGSTAYHLAQEDHTDVVLIERDTIAAGPSGRAAGIVMGVKTAGGMKHNDAGEPIVDTDGIREFNQMRQYCKALYSELEDRHQLEYNRIGFLQLCTNEDREREYEEIVRIVNELGDEVEYVRNERLRKLMPDLNTYDTCGAIYSPNDGWVDPHQATSIFITSAVESGVDVRTNTSFEGVRMIDGEISAVETDSGKIKCENVVNAAGAWAPKVAQEFGVELPVTPYRRQLALLQADFEREYTCPATFDPSTGLYWREDKGGAVLFGVHNVTGYPGEQPVHPDRYDQGYDGGFIRRITDDIDTRLARWKDSEVVDGWACHYATTPDGNPIIDNPGPEGFSVAAGFNGGGIARSPLAGKLTAELVMKGEMEFIVDQSIFSNQRFD